MATPFLKKPSNGSFLLLRTAGLDLVGNLQTEYSQFPLCPNLNPVNLLGCLDYGETYPAGPTITLRTDNDPGRVYAFGIVTNGGSLDVTDSESGEAVRRFFYSNQDTELAVTGGGSQPRANHPLGASLKSPPLKNDSSLASISSQLRS